MHARHSSGRLSRRAALWAVVAAFAPTETGAATSGIDATPTGQLEEIIVTARRREEPLLDVPVAVSVLTQTELEQRQIVDLKGLQYAAPNLSMTTDQTNRASSLIAMRGQFEPMSVPSLDSTVGLYLDGVYIARITGANLRLIDMERVEVLRGPQGTLFGRNTIGGAINLVTKAPSAELEGYVEAAVGNYDRRELTAVANLPMQEGRHALRLVAAHTEHDGFGRSVLLDRDLNDDRTDFARAQFRWTLATQWELNLAGDYTRFENGGQLWTLMAASPLAGLVTIASGSPADDIQNYVEPLNSNVMANRAGSVNTKVEGLSATVTYFGPRWTFKSITAGRRLESRALGSDQDGTPYDLGAVLRRHDEQEQFTQELQFSGQVLNEKLDWILGAHYFVERGLFDQEFLTFSPFEGSWIENLPNGSVRNDSSAAYAQLSYAISPRVRVAAGVRVNEDGRQLTSRNARRTGGMEICRLDLALRDSPEICRTTLPQRHFRYAPYMFGVDFTPMPRALLYAKVSRGYRSGGYNFRGATPIDLAPFDPERVTAWEAGARAELLDSRLHVDVALFRSDFDEIQLVQRRFLAADAQTHLFIENGGRARIDGGEFEFTALLSPVRLRGGLGLVNPRYTKLHPEVVEVNADSRFLNTPEVTAALAADLPIHTAFGRVDLHADHTWRDDVPFEYDPDSSVRQRAYGLWNARVRVLLAQSDLCVGIWGRNLTDKRYIVRALNNGVHVSAAPGDPRTWGVNIRYPCGGGSR